MLEYVILFIFIMLVFYPLHMNPMTKLLELILVVYAGYKSPLIGLFCAIIFMYSMSHKPDDKEEKHSETANVLSERMRPQDSNQTMCTGKTVDTTFLPNESYTAYNVEL